MLTPKRRPKSPYWILRGTIDGKRVEVSRKWKTAAEARRAIPAILDEHQADQVRAGELTFRQAKKRYVADHPNARFVDKLADHFNDRPVAEITNNAMRAAAAKLYPDAAPATLRRQLYTPMKAILNHAAAEDLCAAPRLKAPKGGNTRVDWLTPAQADALLLELAKEKNQFLAPMVTLLIGQGCRMGEAVQIDSSDVSLEHRIITLRHTKNGEERRVTLIPRVVAALSTLPTIGVPGQLFRREDGYPFATSEKAGGQIKTQFRRAVTRAGLDPKRFTPHVCRHTWATWFYAQTLDVRRLKDEGGWKSSQWERYTKLGTPELGADALKKNWNFALSGENRGNEKQDATGTNG